MHGLCGEFREDAPSLLPWRLGHGDKNSDHDYITRLSWGEGSHN
jgi:hypothetical protein